MNEGERIDRLEQRVTALEEMVREMAAGQRGSRATGQESAGQESAGIRSTWCILHGFGE